MKKLNKKLALAMLSLGFAALTPSVASADNYAYRNNDSCNPCNDPCRTNDSRTNDCCSFDFAVDFLYWKPCVDDLDYAATVSGQYDNVDNPMVVTYKSVCPDWEPGFRLTLSREDAWKCFDLSFSYTWLKSTSSQSTHAGNGDHVAAVGLHPFLVDENPGPDLFFTAARGKWELTYQQFDILFSYPFRCGSCHTIAPFFGVEIVKFDQSWKSAYAFVPGDPADPVTVGAVKWSSDFKGAGLVLGTDYKYVLCEGLSLFARASGTILVGDAKDTSNEQALFNVTPGTGEITSPHYIRFDDNDCCRFVPGCHLQLGFMYEDETCGCEYKIRVGYEMVKWYNLQNPRRWFEDETDGHIANSTQSNTTTLGFHGLLVGFEAKF